MNSDMIAIIAAKVKRKIPVKISCLPIIAIFQLVLGEPSSLYRSSSFNGCLLIKQAPKIRKIPISRNAPPPAMAPVIGVTRTIVAINPIRRFVIMKPVPIIIPRSKSFSHKNHAAPRRSIR